ncbi:MAG: hypothetical protein IPJ48_16895 [Propionivibrio sp.]|uniref:Uncharacterized protein n=1 Tax=Candidatus Propionivibrio dominans TaxID=2954373 RepID=A0A9D7I9Y0_9RHOO|nr:hypothetical protein [Candidatus Propionivibrio dominans]
MSQVEPGLYPRAESLLPYYLAILIHAAGNPDPIAELERDCLQPLPLLDDRQTLVWFKPRANAVQRRAFGITDCFEPPALVQEILQWNERLRPLAPNAQRNRLFLYKGNRGVSALSSSTIKHMLKAFCKRHGLPRFALASIRPGVLCSFYRASGDLRRTSAVANHAQLATTVRYVETPEVQAQHRITHRRIAERLHWSHRAVSSTVAAEPAVLHESSAAFPHGELVSMFGFGCTDPLAGTAPAHIAAS